MPVLMHPVAAAIEKQSNEKSDSFSKFGKLSLDLFFAYDTISASGGRVLPMTEIFEISKFDSYREDNRREVKKNR